jgi:hypothetical protein
MAKPAKPVPAWRHDLEKPPGSAPDMVIADTAAPDVVDLKLPAGPAVWRNGVIKPRRKLCVICRRREVPASRGHSKTCSPECGKELERRRDKKPERKARRREIYVPHPSVARKEICTDCGNEFLMMPRGASERCPDCRHERRMAQQRDRWHANAEEKQAYLRDWRAANREEVRTRARRIYHLDAEKIRPYQNARRNAKRKPRDLTCQCCGGDFQHRKPGTAPMACPKPECQEAHSKHVNAGVRAAAQARYRAKHPDAGSFTPEHCAKISAAVKATKAVKHQGPGPIP